jgi:hypothetical protein
MCNICILCKKYLFVNAIETRFETSSKKNDARLLLFDTPKRLEISGEVTDESKGCEIERIKIIDRVGNKVITTIIYSINSEPRFVIKHNGFDPTWFGYEKLKERHVSPTKYVRFKVADDSRSKFTLRLYKSIKDNMLKRS